MSLSDDKKSVFTTIGAFTSLKQERKPANATNLFPSVNNKKDSVSFLLDVLKVVVGSDALKDLTGKLFTNFVDNIEPKCKTAQKKHMTQYNSGDGLPDYFKNDGVTVPVKSIDVYGKLKTNPSSSGGNLIYNQSTNNFDRSAYNAINNSDNDTTYNNMVIRYNSAADTFTFKPNPSSINSSTTIGDWFNGYINNTTLIDKKEFLTNTMNNVYGSVTANQGKTIEQVYLEQQINKLIEQLIDDDDSFELSQKDYDSLLQRAEELVNGIVHYDMGCGRIEASLSIEDMSSLINNISNSSDFFAVGNAVESTINKSLSDNQETADNNSETIKDGFFQKLLKGVVLILVSLMILAPQIRALLAIMSAFQNNGASKIGSPKDDLKNFKTFIKCMTNEVTSMLNEFIFNLVVSFLVILLAPVIKTIAKEKINQYINVLKSLLL
jgi:hypothetical protein